MPALRFQVRSLRSFRTRAAVLLSAVVLVLVLVLPGILLRSGVSTGTTTWSAGPPSPAASESECGVAPNPIVCENALPGAHRWEWDVAGMGDKSIQGFATDISVNVGSRVDFKIKTDAEAYVIDIYRTGWYGGLGARRVANVPVTAALPQRQPACVSDAATELVDCGNWAVSASWAVPSAAVSGVYLARLRRTDTGGASHITFIVRNDASRSDLVFQTSDTTWQAYNTYGGSSFYVGKEAGRAYKVSYNRPFATRGDTGPSRDFYFGAEYPMVRFLERNGYDVTYQSGVDTDRAGALLKNHRVFLSVGHDEYWSGAQRKNVDAARDAGVNLAFFSGNHVYWRTRYEGAVAGAATAYRTLVCYKETWFARKADPSPDWTGTWRDPRFAPTSVGAGVPENSLAGTMYMANDVDLPVTVSAAEGQNRLWRNSSLTSLTAGESVKLAPHTVGYESDEDLDNGSRPPGLIRLSTTTGLAPAYLQDFGATTKQAPTRHHLTLYRAASGALVFSAGTIRWSWGVDEMHDGLGAPANADMQQATVNMLADMRAQPASLMPGLDPAEASTDTSGPSATITTPAAGTTVANGSLMTVTGTAVDVGGQVAGVEVSTDDGATWHPATGTSSWTYSYIRSGVGAATVIARAIDDSANIGLATDALPVTVTCPCSVFGTTVPDLPAADDSVAVELGMRVTPSVAGLVTAIRFYKGPGNVGPHTGTVWSVAGAPLASVVFTNETAVGWQVAQLATPVPVAAGQTVVVSYTAPQGRYAADPDAFSGAGLSAPPLSVAGGFGTETASSYGNPGTFPAFRYQDANYYVDLAFSPA